MARLLAPTLLTTSLALFGCSGTSAESAPSTAPPTKAKPVVCGIDQYPGQRFPEYASFFGVRLAEVVYPGSQTPEALAVTVTEVNKTEIKVETAAAPTSLPAFAKVGIVTLRLANDCRSNGNVFSFYPNMTDSDITMPTLTATPTP